MLIKIKEVSEGKKNNLFNLPNALSLARILLIPVFLVLIANRKTVEAFVVFIIAGFTDVLDGFTARFWNQKTKIGALLDPAADKLLMTASFIALTLPALNSFNVIPLWLTIAVVGRDLYIVSGAFAAYKLRGQKKFPPSILGKTCTVFEWAVVTLVLFFNSLQISTPYLNWLYLLTLAFTFLSGAHYSYIGYKIMSAAKQG